MNDLKRLLAATDGSDPGNGAVVTAGALAQRAGASLDIVTALEVLLLPDVYAPPGLEVGEYEDRFMEEARTRAADQAEDAGLSEAPIHVRAGMAAPIVADLADELEADLIVVGAHPRPAVARTLVGSTAERVLRLARRPVMAAVEARREPFRRILAGIDLSGQSGRVLQTAAAFAQTDKAALRALYVQEPLPMMLVEAAVLDGDEVLRRSREQMGRHLEEAGLPSGVEIDGRMREGDAGEEIMKEAQDWDADLIVVGSHGFGFFDRLLLGNTSLHVLRHGDRATVIVPRGGSRG